MEDISIRIEQITNDRTAYRRYSVLVIGNHYSYCNFINIDEWIQDDSKLFDILQAVENPPERWVFITKS